METSSVFAMQQRYFELMRTRRFVDVDYVPNAREVLYTHEEGGKHYPRIQHLCCPTSADDAEMCALEAAIEAAGVRMYL